MFVGRETPPLPSSALRGAAGDKIKTANAALTESRDDRESSDNRRESSRDTHSRERLSIATQHAAHTHTDTVNTNQGFHTTHR